MCNTEETQHLQEYIISCSVFRHVSCRLDKYLSTLVEYLPIKVSRSQIERMCKSMVVNGKSVKRSYNVQEKDELHVVLEAPCARTSVSHASSGLDFGENVKDAPLPQKDYSTELEALDILYEDTHLMAVNKPRGMVVHPGAGNRENTLAQIVFTRLTSYREEDKFNHRAGIVHRLDKDTSGIVMVAKTAQAHDKLSRLFSQRQVEKKYLAIVKGIPKNRAESIKTYIGRHASNRQKFCVVANEKNGKFAHTDYRIVANNEYFAVLLCTIHTGRTHQIRVHMQHIGCPIVGDAIYSRNTIKYKLFGEKWAKNLGAASTVTSTNILKGRGECADDLGEKDCPLMLHAYEIEFALNIRDEIMPYHVVAPIPPDMNDALAYMGVTNHIEDYI